MRFHISYALILSVLLSGCGKSGGGDGGGSASTGPVTSTLAFPFLSADKTTVANGWTKNFTISGNCSGSGTVTISPAATAATFEGVPALASGRAITGSYTNCTPASFAETRTSYFDSNYIRLGSSSSSSYSLYLTPLTIPTSVTVGTSGTMGTSTTYTDSTKATGNGRTDVSYVIEADTSTTAIVNVIQKNYNSAGTLTATSQSRDRIAATGALTPISLDLQGATHELWTYH